MSQPSTRDFSSAHFIGIGGAGMSGIALVLHERGHAVSGSDLKSSRYVRKLEQAGVDVTIGHEAATIDRVNPDVVVISTAIPDTNPELVRARELGIPVWHRAMMLSALSEDAKTVAVAGTHGKTTTSSMVATMLDKIGRDPSFLIGGFVEGYDTNGRNGKGGYFVAEADESDGSFLYLNPHIAVVTNIEADHLDHYGTLEKIEETFCKFMGLVGEEGCVVVYGDDAHLVDLARSTGRRVLTYGFDEKNDYVVRLVRKESLASLFDVTCPGDRCVRVNIKHNPGDHNMLNATASIAVADALGCDIAEAAAGLSEFKGASRRFTHVGDACGICVVDDYGHHPTEIKKTLAAGAELDFERVVCVFQPHRYSRTRDLADEFAVAFDSADVLFVLDVFPAGEMPIPGVTGKALARRIEAEGDVAQVTFVPNRLDLIGILCDTCREGDLVFTMGAGDVTTVGPDLIRALRERAGESGEE